MGIPRYRLVRTASILSVRSRDRRADAIVAARAIVFAAPGASAPQAAVVVLDNLGADLTLVRQMRDRAALAVPGLKPETIMVAATHTHSAPTLRKYHAQELPDSIRQGQRITGMTSGQDSLPVAASVFKFHQRKLGNGKIAR